MSHLWEAVTESQQNGLLPEASAEAHVAAGLYLVTKQEGLHTCPNPACRALFRTYRYSGNREQRFWTTDGICDLICPGCNSFIGELVAVEEPMSEEKFIEWQRNIAESVRSGWAIYSGEGGRALTPEEAAASGVKAD